MALMAEPRLLLLDEPTAGINPTLINGLIERLKRVNADLAITLLVIEHNMRVIMNLAEHIYCLAHGELLADGPPTDPRRPARDRRLSRSALMAPGETVEARRARTGATASARSRPCCRSTRCARGGGARRRGAEARAPARARRRRAAALDREPRRYGRMQILHGFSLAVAKGQSLCLIGPNGAGKSTVLHSIYGFTTITAAPSASRARTSRS